MCIVGVVRFTQVRALRSLRWDSVVLVNDRTSGVNSGMVGGRKE